MLPMAITGVKGDEELKNLWLKTLTSVEGLEKEKLIIFGNVIEESTREKSNQRKSC